MEELPAAAEQPPHCCVGITFNLKRPVTSDVPDDEAEYDEYSTILAIQKAIENGGYRTVLLEATQDLPQKLIQAKPDIVFNIAEGAGGRGREAQVPALLGFFGIPHTGSDEAALSIALDKALTKRILASYRIRTPKWAVVGRANEHERVRVPLPAIVKPNAEGSSKGIGSFSVVSSAKELREVLHSSLTRYRQDMLVEEFVEGREFTVGLLGNGSDLHVFPPMEIVYHNTSNRFNIYSFEVKKDFKAHVRYECPANVSAELRTEIEDTARKIFTILGCRDFARIDFRLSPEGKLHFIEINPLPGLAPGYSDYPMLAQFCGIEYDALVRGVLAAAMKRCGLPGAAR